MPRPWVAPAGLVPSLRHTRKNPPENHSQLELTVALPPGPIGEAFMSATSLHRPAKYASFCTSGPGLGGAGGACALSAGAASSAAVTAARARYVIRIRRLLSRKGTETYPSTDTALPPWLPGQGVRLPRERDPDPHRRHRVTIELPVGGRTGVRVEQDAPFPTGSGRGSRRRHLEAADPAPRRQPIAHLDRCDVETRHQPALREVADVHDGMRAAILDSCPQHRRLEIRRRSLER